MALPRIPRFAMQGRGGNKIASERDAGDGNAEDRGRADTPAASDRLRRGSVRNAAALAEPEVARGFRDAGAIVAPLPPAALAKRLRSDTEKWARVIALLNVPKK